MLDHTWVLCPNIFLFYFNFIIAIASSFHTPELYLVQKSLSRFLLCLLLYPPAFPNQAEDLMSFFFFKEDYFCYSSLSLSLQSPLLFSLLSGYCCIPDMSWLINWVPVYFLAWLWPSLRCMNNNHENNNNWNTLCLLYASHCAGFFGCLSSLILINVWDVYVCSFLWESWVSESKVV